MLSIRQQSAQNNKRKQHKAKLQLYEEHKAKKSTIKTRVLSELV